MIEIKIQDDLAQYIDTEKLQNQAEYEVINQIKNTITDMVKANENAQKMIEKISLKIINETKFSDEVILLIQTRLIESIKNMSDWDIQYQAKLAEFLSDLIKDKNKMIQSVLNDKIDETILNYQINKYDIFPGLNEIITKKIMEQTEFIDLKEKLNMFVKNGVERIMEQISY